MNTPPVLTAKQRAAATARSILEKNPVYLDTETTGLSSTDEIIEISIIDSDGTPLVETLVKPSRPIPVEATAIHGITNEEVTSARTWPVVWPMVRGALFGRVIVIYNQDFDLRMMAQSHARYNLPWKERLNTVDLLKLYAEYRGEWDSKRRSFRYHSLATAGRQCKLSLPNAHRSTADTLLTRAVLQFMAST